MRFKNWLSGPHHTCSKQHLFAYADENVFRFNRINDRNLIFQKIVHKMVNQIPHPYQTFPKKILNILKKYCAKLLNIQVYGNSGHENKYFISNN
jgi:hypothetical protein